MQSYLRKLTVLSRKTRFCFASEANYDLVVIGGGPGGIK